MSKRRYYALCRDAVSGMEFDFELESTNLRTAREEADCKYNGVVFVGAREVAGGGGGFSSEKPSSAATSQNDSSSATQEDAHE